MTVISETCPSCGGSKISLSKGEGPVVIYCAQRLPVPSEVEYLECADCKCIFFTTSQIIAFNTAMDRELEVPELPKATDDYDGNQNSFCGVWSGKNFCFGPPWIITKPFLGVRVVARRWHRNICTGEAWSEIQSFERNYVEK